MNITPMLARLQSALGRTDLIDQMVLLPQSSSSRKTPVGDGEANDDGVAQAAVNLVVGYDGSPESQTALDLTLWIAHQTRLATRNQVTVHVVHVISDIPTQGDRTYGQRRDLHIGAPKVKDTRRKTKKGNKRVTAQVAEQAPREATLMTQRGSAAVAELPVEAVPQLESLMPIDPLEHADRILWQVRCMADEWRGSLKTHLRFGSLSAELKSVVQAEAAAVLLLGCDSQAHPLIKTLGREFPCPVLGIPPALHIS